ncbi:hypothetical protein V1512DRAFT_263741 [Lipomyces arxii]|uniref:uncharacterized protein n=1 Tax=Lipomyces arxii TaxID=56418 RepID=UPI0034CEDA7A
MVEGSNGSLGTSQRASCVSCQKNNPSYKCPACLAPYCSVACFASHKQRSSCKGMKDISDAVLRYIPRNELIGSRGYSEFGNDNHNVEGDDNESEESRKRQLLGDRDYNFLSLLERRVEVQRNVVQDVIRRGSKRARSRGSRGRGRNRGGLTSNSTRQNSHTAGSDVQLQTKIESASEDTDASSDDNTSSSSSGSSSSGNSDVTVGQKFTENESGGHVRVVTGEINEDMVTKNKNQAPSKVGNEESKPIGETQTTELVQSVAEDG